MFRLLLFLLSVLSLVSAQSGSSSFEPANLLATELKSPMELQVIPSKTSTVYRAREGEWQFNLHSYVAWYDGQFWAIWSSGPVNEDSPHQLIRYSTSRDGHNWTPSRILVEDPDGPEGPELWIARGVFVHQNRLKAFGAQLRRDSPRERNGRREAWADLRLIQFEWTGSHWQNKGLLLEDCMNNYPPAAIRNRLFMTCRDGFMTMHTALAQGIKGEDWERTRLPGAPPHDWMSEPSWYIDPQGLVHMIFRDHRRSRYLYRSVSRDHGKTWPAPVRTDYPDATSKNFTGKLSNGWYFLINNPNQKGRDPLAISLSRDGWTFNHARALRKDAPPLRYAGQAKPSGSFQYPHALEKGGSLWVIYATNKEDIEISEFRLTDLIGPNISR